MKKFVLYKDAIQSCLAFCLKKLNDSRLKQVDVGAILGNYAFLFLFLINIAYFILLTLEEMNSSMHPFNMTEFIKLYNDPGIISVGPYGWYPDIIYHFTPIVWSSFIYGIIIPLLSVLRFRIHKVFLMIVDLLIISFLIPCIFRYCLFPILDELFKSKDIYFFIRFIGLFCIFPLTYFRVLFYKHRQIHNDNKTARRWG